ALVSHERDAVAIAGASGQRTQQGSRGRAWAELVQQEHFFLREGPCEDLRRLARVPLRAGADQIDRLLQLGESAGDAAEPASPAARQRPRTVAFFIRGVPNQIQPDQYTPPSTDPALVLGRIGTSRKVTQQFRFGSFSAAASRRTAYVDRGGRGGACFRKGSLPTDARDGAFSAPFASPHGLAPARSAALPAGDRAQRRTSFSPSTRRCRAARRSRGGHCRRSRSGEGGSSSRRRERSCANSR